MSSSFNSSSPSSSPSASSSSSGGFERRAAERRKLRNIMLSRLQYLETVRYNPSQNQRRNRRKKKIIDDTAKKVKYNCIMTTLPRYLCMTNVCFVVDFECEDTCFCVWYTLPRHLILTFNKERTTYGRKGLTALQKCTAAIRMLAYGEAADRVDEYLRLGGSTARRSLREFVNVINTQFGAEYLRSPTAEDCQRILHVNEARGFPGSLNDINVLHRSPVFDHLLNGRAPWVSYWVNGTQYNTGYYLTDGIYPRWATFMPAIRNPLTPKDKLFSTRQESVRKDVERAFGVL